MRSPERDTLYIEHMLASIQRVEEYTGGDRQRFLDSPLVQDAVIRNLQVMAESSQRLSEEAKSAHPEVDWPAISGFRNILVHAYLSLELERIWLVIEQDLPPLKAALQKIGSR